jgi:hypothetical protein
MMRRGLAGVRHLLAIVGRILSFLRQVAWPDDAALDRWTDRHDGVP